MKKKVLRIIGIVLIIAIAFIASYIVTYLVDKNNDKGKYADINVTFDDTNYYVIPNTEVMDEEKALKEWPYIFEINNTGNTKGLYQLIIVDDENNDIKRDCLSYILYLNDKEITKGNLKDIEEDVLFETSINGDETQKYKLYIYKNSENEGTIYKYSIYLDAILEGGPGF